MIHPESNLELVGRTQEMEALRTLLHRAMQEHGQVVHIMGEAGIGKTRLIASLASLAREHGLAIIRGECSEQDQDFPYAPIVDGLRTRFSSASSEDIRRIVGPYQQEMVRLLPELALRTEAAPPSSSLEPEADKRRLFEVLVQLYQRLATHGLLLIFEDIHWSDANSLDFFKTLSRRISHLPALVALSSRTAAPNPELANLRLYLERAENARSILLGPLAEDEIRGLTKAALHTSDPIHPALLDNLLTLAQGNPLYTEQLVYALRQNRRINMVNGTWMATASTTSVEVPQTISQTVEQQTQRLSDSAKRVLQLAAVVGRQFELDVIQQLTDLDEHQLTELMKELIHRRVFEESSPNRFAFRHELLRQAIYDGLLMGERLALHRAILRILETRTSPPADTGLARLSYHAYQAQAWEAALRYGLQAGRHALALHAPRAAVYHLTHAIEAAGRLGDDVPWELLDLRGKSHDDLGEFEQALGDYEAALRIAEERSEQKSAWQSLIALALLWSARDYRRTGEYCDRALQAARGMEEPSLIGHSLNRLGNWYLNTGQPIQALEHHEQALAIFQELEDLPGKGETLDLLGMTSGHALRLHDQLSYYQDAVAIFRTLRDQKALASTLSNLALCSLDFAVAEEAIQIARQIYWYSGEVYAYQTAGYLHSLYGHFTRSLTYMRRGQELAQAIDHTQWLAGVQVFSGFVYREMLDLETAATVVKHAIALAESVGSHWFTETGSGLLAQIYVDQGRLGEAAEMLALHPAPELPAMQHIMAMIAEAELAIARGDAQAALRSSDRLPGVWPIGDETIPLSRYVAIPYLKVQARALAALGRTGNALDLLRRARRMCASAGLLPQLWQIDALLGQIAGQQDDGAAEAHFQRARTVIDELVEHVPPELRQQFLHNALSRLPNAPAPHEPPAMRLDEQGPAHSRLTRREVEIVREVASGKSNQQVAESLHITVKTVETHLTRILSKLNMTSRTQVALWAAEHRFTLPSEESQGNP